MAVDGEGPDAQLAILMRDVGSALIPEGDDVVAVDVHEGLLDDMAALHAAFWGWSDDLGLQTMNQRLRMFAPVTIAPELAVDGAPDAVPPPIRVADEGWRRLPDVAPGLATLVLPFHDDPTPLIDALAATPTTFVHGDWKMGNLGRHSDGRTVLLDWAYPGSGPGCWDLMWYLASEPGPSAAVEGAVDRALPVGARGRGCGHLGVVGAPARARPDRDDDGVRLGEGGRRSRRAGVVAGPRPRRRPLASLTGRGGGGTVRR